MWKDYIEAIDRSAARKTGSFYRSKRFLTPEIFLHIYKTTIRS